MDCLIRRNPPVSPFSEKFDAEILLSLYREGMQRRVFRGGCYELAPIQLDKTGDMQND